MLNERSQTILKAIVLAYIRTAFPIGSRSLTKQIEMNLSPATIRNVMADLEETGYLTHPHTSAGRVPTEKGYRFYVDSLMEDIRRASSATQRAIEPEYLARIEGVKELLQETSRMLSLLTSYTALVLGPRFSTTIFRHVEFVQLRPRQILAILVSEDGLIQNRVVEVEREYQEAELDRIAAFLDARCAGLTLQLAKQRLVEEMGREKEQYDRLLDEALRLVGTTFVPAGNEQLFVEGTTHILESPEFADIQKMKALFQAFEEKYRIVRFLDQCLEAEGVQVYIGSENSFLGLNDCSLVVSSYKRGDRMVGTLGVIGPTRMDYSRVIPLVDHTARLLSRLLEEK